MKTILISGIIVECIVLALLTILKKWTGKAFLAITVITAVCCGLAGYMAGANKGPDSQENQRADLYMAARLIQEEFYEESLEVLSLVDDEEGAAWQAPAVRALSYNLNGAYETGEAYAKDRSDIEQAILEACIDRKPVAKEDRVRITESTLELIGASDQEARRWDAEMKVRFMGLDLSPEEKEELTDDLALAKEAIREKRYRDAYDQLADRASGGDVKTGIILSGMYVKTYDLRLMTDPDEEYERLWKEAASLQADLNLVSLEVEPGDTSGSRYTEYRKAKAEYDLAMEELRIEAAKRAVNYLQAMEDDDMRKSVGYQLQLSRLYFISRQMDEARACLDQIFAADQTDKGVWLGTEAEAFRQAYILSLSDPLSDEYSLLFDRLMDALYQSLFDDDNYDTYKEFVLAYLRELYGGIAIRKIDASGFPQIRAHVSATREDVEIDQARILVKDTEEILEDFQVEAVEIGDLNLCFVLDKSGSMNGEAMTQSKSAIRSCIAGMEEGTFMNLVTFDNTASLECNLSQSKYLVMNLVEGVEAEGGTNIASGLSVALDSLRAAAGTRVVILLSDGYDQSSSRSALEGILAEAAAADVVVYTIGLEGCDESYLESIANRTGGQFIMAANTTQLNKIYREIQNSLMKSYIITYKVNEEAESRYLELREKESSVRARKRYSTAETQQSSTVSTGGLQEAGYYKQTGGTDRR